MKLQLIFPVVSALLFTSAQAISNQGCPSCKEENYLQCVPTPNGAVSASQLDDASIPNSIGQLTETFSWNSTEILISPKNDSRNLAGIKDPSIIYHNGVYHVFASTSKSEGYNLVYLNFTHFSRAKEASFFYLDQSEIGPGYRAAPQVFFFKPQKLWYLVYQNGNAAYSTNTDISNPAGWSAPKTFFADMPDIIKANIGNGYWVDMWVICDDHLCHHFSSDDNGHLYRAETALSRFPDGFTEPIIAMQDVESHRLFEASNIYKVEGRKTTYLLIVEAIGTDGRRWFRSWTAPKIEGPWKGLADSEEKPFARANNVVFPKVANGTTSGWTFE